MEKDEKVIALAERLNKMDDATQEKLAIVVELLPLAERIVQTRHEREADDRAGR